MRRERLSFRALRDVRGCEVDAKSPRNTHVSMRGGMWRERLMRVVSASHVLRAPLMQRKRFSSGVHRDVCSCEIDAKSALGRVSVPAGRHAA